MNDRIDPNTPVIVGVGQYAERPTDKNYRALSPVELGAEAARATLADAGAPGLAAALDTVGGIRQFEISGPGAVTPFGASNNYPRSVAKRVGANPRRAFLDIVGGQGPQRVLGELAAEIARGISSAAMIVGSEAMSTVLHLKAKGETPDWSETVDGALEERGFGFDGLLSPTIARHRGRGVIPIYALFENARRARLGKSREDYARDMGDLFAPFTRVAAGNPYSAAPRAMSADELIAVDARNRIVSDPYTRMLVARDQVNQAAAVIVVSAAKAEALGIARDKWIFLHGQADGNEVQVTERRDLSASPASIATVKAALDRAGIGMDDVSAMDLYSCFPIAVFNILDGFALAADDPRGFTLTGGLPYFGGPGNNYSMHGIAEAVARLRAKPDAYGLVGANGGMLSKYSAGIYSAKPADWRDVDARVAKLPKSTDIVPENTRPEGAGKVETYTIFPFNNQDVVMILGRLDASGERFVAIQREDDTATAGEAKAVDPIGRKVEVAALDDSRNAFRFVG